MSTPSSSSAIPFELQPPPLASTLRVRVRKDMKRDVRILAALDGHQDYSVWVRNALQEIIGRNQSRIIQYTNRCSSAA